MSHIMEHIYLFSNLVFLGK